MVKDRLTEIGGEADAGFRCKILGSKAAGKTGSCHKDQNKKPLDDVAMIILSHSHIDDLGNDKGDDQVKHDFQKLEKRCKNTFLFIFFQIARK